MSGTRRAGATPGAVGARPRAAIPPTRSAIEIRWRQFRNAPRPVVRAVASSLIAATVGGLGYLAYDVALLRGAELPGGDLRLLLLVAYTVLVLAVGSIATWWLVPLPAGAGTRATRTPWSAALGLLAAVPICYLVMVVVVQLIEPLIVAR